MKLKTIKDYDLNNKRVIIRLDLNVPMENGQITDDTKIKESLATIEYAYQHNAKVILMSHLGRVKEEKDKLTSSLEPVSKKLSKLLNKEVKFSKETSGANLKNIVDNMNNGEILLIENTRFEDIDNKKESSCNLELSKYWASLGDIFINDAYGSAHRAHASNVGIANLLPNGIGFLVEKELTKINTFLEEDTHPYIVIMGGKKVEDKIKIIENLITKCDKLIIGGAMSYTFLKVKGYNVENNIIDENSIDFCHSMLNKYKDKMTFLNKKELNNLEVKLAESKKQSKLNKEEVERINNEINTITNNIAEAQNSIEKANKRIELNEEEISKKKDETDELLKYFQVSSNENVYIEYLMLKHIPNSFIDILLLNNWLNIMMNFLKN